MYILVRYTEVYLILRDARVFVWEVWRNASDLFTAPGTKVSPKVEKSRRPNDVAIIEPSVFSNFHH